MITIPVSVSIDNDANGIPKGTPPYTFTFSSNNSTCVSFSEPTGTCVLIDDKYTAETDVEYVNQTCIATSLITCVITDANGCSVTKSPLVIDNPCDIVTSISTNGEFVFVATTTGGSGNYTYSWNWDKVFEKQVDDLSDTDNTISLRLRPYETLPISTLITVNVTDSNGCKQTANYVYNFCFPRTFQKWVSLVCDTAPVTGCSSVVSQYRNLDISDVSLCAGQTLDWSTLTLGIPHGLCVYHDGAGMLTISSSLTTTQSKIINYSVKTTAGVRSTIGIITVTIPTCTEATFLGATPQTIQLTIEDIVSDVKLLPVEPRVAGTPDWSTFAFTNTPSWGTVVINGNREIEYTITNVATTPTIPDVIKWSLNDYKGNQVNVSDTVLRDRIALPVTTTETICSSCGETTAAQDLLANDTGDIDRSTIQIVLNDPDVIITKDTDNNFTFTALPGASFNNLNSYKVANTQGAYTADQNFIVRTACVGPNTTPILNLTCEVLKTDNIADQFPDKNCFGLAFAETSTIVPTYTTQGGTIGGTGDIDFTGINPGTYTFEFTCLNQGSCTPDWDDIGILTVINGATPNVTFTSATDNTDGTSTYEFSYDEVASAFIVTLNGSPASFQSSVLASNGVGNFTIYNTAGLNTVMISTSSTCSTSINDTDSTLTI